MSSKKSVFINIMLVMVSVMSLYLILEFIVFPRVLTYVPLKFRPFLRPGIDVLAQNSKRSVLPKDYIALTGDSYAYGAGDWYLNSDFSTNPRNTSGHLINEQTGVDTVAIAWGAYGSINGIAKHLYCSYLAINSLGFHIDPPKTILIYFYEGNDLNNNIHTLNTTYYDKYDKKLIFDKDNFNTYLEKQIVGSDHECQIAKNPRIIDRLIFAKFVIKIIRSALVGGKYSVSTKDVKDPPSAGKYNVAMVSGKKVNLPDRLQSPALMLDDEEMRLSLYAFERSLVFMMERFPSSNVAVIYLPSVIASYKIVSETVSVQAYGKKKFIFDTSFAEERSDYIASTIKEMSLNNNARFLDSRPYIRAASQNKIIHGPIDWRHYNKLGYEALIKAITENLGDIL